MLPNEILIEKARATKKTAYCKYSQFPVGAVVVASDNEIFEGSNIENSSYGLAICAERVAIFKAVSNGVRKIKCIAVSCGSPEMELKDNEKMPCGACLQVLSEFSDENTEILVDGLGRFKLTELLPKPFSLS